MVAKESEEPALKIMFSQDIIYPFLKSDCTKDVLKQNLKS
jgi:hypothetical protein